jgi:hypothetical protein
MVHSSQGERLLSQLDAPPPLPSGIEKLREIVFEQK